MKILRRRYWIILFIILICGVTLLISVSLLIVRSSGKDSGVKTDIIEYLENHTADEPCHFRMDEVTDFAWDRLIFYDGSNQIVSNEDLSQIIGHEHTGSTYGYGMIFLEGERIVAEYFEPSTFEPSRGSLYSGIGWIEPRIYVFEPDDAVFGGGKAYNYYYIFPYYRPSKDNLNNIKRGMTIEEVTDIIGPPTENIKTSQSDYESNEYIELHYMLGSEGEYQLILRFLNTKSKETELQLMWIEENGEMFKQYFD